MSKRGASRTTKSWLGATEPVGTLPIVVFVPGQDRDGNDIDHDLWVTRALETLGALFRGATPIHAHAAYGVMTNEAESYSTKSQRLSLAMPILRR